MPNLYETYLYPRTLNEKKLEEKIASGEYHLEIKTTISPNGWIVKSAVAIKNKF